MTGVCDIYSDGGENLWLFMNPHPYGDIVLFSGGFTLI